MATNKELLKQSKGVVNGSNKKLAVRVFEWSQINLLLQSLFSVLSLQLSPIVVACQYRLLPVVFEKIQKYTDPSVPVFSKYSFFLVPNLGLL
jgi:hypothetical protein